jgi:hypothetical protein
LARAAATPPAIVTEHPGRRTQMPVTAVSTFQHFFRTAASVDVDKNDLKRYIGLVDEKVDDP